MQVVAASATVGRPLRRELYRILQGGEGYGEVQVIRPLDVNPDDPSGPQSGSTRKVIDLTICFFFVFFWFFIQNEY